MLFVFPYDSTGNHKPGPGLSIMFSLMDPLCPITRVMLYMTQHCEPLSQDEQKTQV